MTLLVPTPHSLIMHSEKRAPSTANLSTQLIWLTLLIIPSAIGKLIGLTFIGLSYNYLESPIPISIAKLSYLQLFNRLSSTATKEERYGPYPSPPLSTQPIQQCTFSMLL